MRTADAPHVGGSHEAVSQSWEILLGYSTRWCCVCRWSMTSENTKPRRKSTRARTGKYRDIAISNTNKYGPSAVRGKPEKEDEGGESEDK